VVKKLLSHQDASEVGDKLIVRLTVETDRAMDYRSSQGLRASGFEPMDVISGYHWGGGIGYYQSTKTWLPISLSIVCRAENISLNIQSPLHKLDPIVKAWQLFNVCMLLNLMITAGKQGFSIHELRRMIIQCKLIACKGV
jgi:hypothetical protein